MSRELKSKSNYSGEERKLTIIDTDILGNEVVDVKEKSMVLALKIANSTSSTQDKVMFVEPPYSKTALSTKPSVEIRKDIPTRSASINIPTRNSNYKTREISPRSSSCPARIINVDHYDKSYIIGRLNKKVKDGKSVHIIGNILPHEQIEKYKFDSKLNKLTISNVSSLLVEIEAAIYGIEIIHCTDIKIVTHQFVNIRVEYSHGITIIGPAEINTHNSLDILHNVEQVRASPFYSSEMFVPKIGNSFIRINQINEEENKRLQK